MKTIYSVSTNFRLMLINPSARDGEGQQFFFGLTLFRVTIGLSKVLFSFLARPGSKKTETSSRLFDKRQAKISADTLCEDDIQLGI